jgi:hypothetical protein
MGELVKSPEELAEMDDVSVNTEVEPEEAELESGFELELVDPEMYGREKPQELLDAEQRLADLQAQNQSLKATTTQQEALAATMASVKQLQEQLASGIRVQSEEKKSPGFDLDAHRAKFNKNLYSDPAKMTEEFLAPYLGELKSDIDSTKIRADRNASKADLLADDSGRATYLKYKDEVEKIVQDMPASPDVYQKALTQVRAVHFDDFVQEEVARQLAQTQGPKPPLTNVGRQVAPAGQKKSQITPGMKRYMDALRMKGVGNEEYAYRRAKELKASGQIKD